MKVGQIPEYYFRKDYEDMGFEIVRLEYFFNQQHEAEKTIPHRLKFYAMIFIEEGEGIHYIDFKPYRYETGSLLFIGKNQVHKWQEKNNSKGFCIFFTERFLFNNQVRFDDLSYAYPFNSKLYSPKLDTFGTAVYDVLLLLIPLLHKEYSVFSTTGNEETLQCLLRVLILKIQSSTYAQNDVVGEEIRTLFIDFQKKLEQNISITRNALDYCSMLNVSYYRLNKVVKTLTKRTVKAFIDEILILNAKRLLFENVNNTSEVSYMLGFEEATNFTKFFKKHTGKTPKYFKDTL